MYRNFPLLRSLRLICLSLLVLHSGNSALQAQSKASGLQRIAQSVLPIVTLQKPSEDYRFLGNSVIVSDDGYLVAPSQIFRNLPLSMLLPVARVGALVPSKGISASLDPVSDRVFQRIQVLHLDEAAGLALLRLEGPLRKAKPVTDGPNLSLGDGARIFGFGGPGTTPWVFQAHVAATPKVPGLTPAGTRYALDARVTSAADGGLTFNSKGEAHALTLLHLKSVHRVVHKLGATEFGPSGTAVGIPMAALRSWIEAVKPPASK